MDYVIIESVDGLRPYMPALQKAGVMAADTETTGLNPHSGRIRLIQLAAAGLPVVIIDCFKFLPAGADLLAEIMESSGVKVFQNAKFDLQFFMSLGINPAPIFDTMLAGQLLHSSGGPPRVNLAALAKHYLGEDVEKDEQKSDWRGELRPAQIEYAARDALILLRLREAMVMEIYANGLQSIARIEFSCVRAVAQMEYAGIGIDLARWSKLTAKIERDRDEALETLYEYAGRPMTQMSLTGDGVVLNHNFDSNPYIVGILRDNGIEVDATSKRVLSAYSSHPLVKALSAYRKAAKALSGFLYPMPHMILPETGRLHPRYGQIGAWSGRMSCGGPNIQQIPRDAGFRACFAAPPGKKLVIADYSQIEIRVAAQISGDGRMIKAYERGEDLHTLTASLVSEVPASAVTAKQRQAAKAVNFGLIYGMGAAGLQQYAQQSYGVDMTPEQAAKFRDNFFNAYTGIAGWHRRIRAEKPVEERTISGRKFTFGQNPGVSVLYNTPVQGTAADIMKSALGKIARKAKGTGVRIIAAVHDEILLEADESESEAAAAMLKHQMELAGNEILTAVPCVADVKIADDWSGK